MTWDLYHWCVFNSCYGAQALPGHQLASSLLDSSGTAAAPAAPDAPQDELPEDLREQARAERQSHGGYRCVQVAKPLLLRHHRPLRAACKIAPALPLPLPLPSQV